MTAAPARGARPVTLRDFLELACDSSSDGFRSYPRCLPWTDDALQAPVRLLVETDLLRRSPSRSPSSLFSLPRSPGPGALARISSLSRSFSRRIREGFWRRRDDDDDFDDLYFDDRDSCGFPSPLVSSCSASDSESEYDADEADVAAAIDAKTACPSASECEKPSPSSPSSSSASASASADHDCTDDGAPGAAADGNKQVQMQAVADGDPAAVGRGGKLQGDKQQLSPVSVLDFPFDDDDGDERSDAGTCSPSFRRCPCPPPPDLLLHRTAKQAQLPHKIRRYDGGIAGSVVDPVDLDARFTTTTSESGESVDDASTRVATTSSCTDTTSSATTAPCHGEDEQQSASREQELDGYRLLARLLHEVTAAAAAVDEVSQMLMLDFFVEGVNRLSSPAAVGTARPVVDDDREVAEALVGAAAEWLRGAGLRWGIGDVMLSGKAALEDMERGRRWMRVGEEERDVAAAVEGFLMDGLVDELVAELVVPWWHGDGSRWSY